MNHKKRVKYARNYSLYWLSFYFCYNKRVFSNSFKEICSKNIQKFFQRIYKSLCHLRIRNILYGNFSWYARTKKSPGILYSYYRKLKLCVYNNFQQDILRRKNKQAKNNCNISNSARNRNLLIIEFYSLWMVKFNNKWYKYIWWNMFTF